MPHSGAQQFAFVTPEWVLRQLPAITYFGENDGVYSVRWVCPGHGHSSGFAVSDLVESGHPFAGTAPHPDDYEVVQDFAHACMHSDRPCIARYNLMRADGSIMPVLVLAMGVPDHAERPGGFCGMVIDLREAEVLQGPSGVLCSGDSAPTGEVPEELTPAWIMERAPAITVVMQDDESYTLRYAGGRAGSLLGYNPSQFIDNTKYRTAWVTLPEDQGISDEAMEAATTYAGQTVIMRVRTTHAQGHAVPALAVLRGVQTDAGGLVVGLVINLSECEALQGPPGVLQTP